MPPTPTDFATELRGLADQVVHKARLKVAGDRALVLDLIRTRQRAAERSGDTTLASALGTLLEDVYALLGEPELAAPSKAPRVGRGRAAPTTLRVVKSNEAAFNRGPETPLAVSLREARTGANLSQRALAELLKVHRSTVTHAETGRHAPADDLVGRWRAACGAV